ncbi:MAG: aminomethyl-transferring glycine dehydrogenase [Ginsengibacter sp.]
MNLFDKQSADFAVRHIGPDENETREMLDFIGIDSIEELMDKTIPAGIRTNEKMDVPDPMSESDYLAELKSVAVKNKVYKSYIGQGYYDTFTPSVILRNLFENPGWYTQYTPYQAEIAQGRLESLLNFQTTVSDLTGLPIANASLLDEGTAAAEGMAMLFNHKNKNTDHITSAKFFVDEKIFKQTRDVLITRATPVGIELVFGQFQNAELTEDYFGACVQYPDSEGSVEDHQEFIEKAHAVNARVVMATDLLALTLLKSPGELGADVAVGSSQRFGVPMGYGGPHAAFFSTKDEFKRNIPGRIIGVTIDAQNQRCLRMALQTREQHIRREKATSNICTAQALLANMAAMYAVYHGPEGLTDIAKRVTLLTRALAENLKESGYELINESYFDTITLKVEDPENLKKIAEKNQMNFHFSGNMVSISLDETTSKNDVLNIIIVFNEAKGEEAASVDFDDEINLDNIPSSIQRNSPFLEHPVFNTYHSETEMMRYMKRLENKDLSLTQSMISLGSCTMKLNAATELIPVSWPEFGKIHPFAPASQTEGYNFLIKDLENLLSTITGFHSCSLQPNSGAQGEFAGLMAIKRYHESRNEGNRNVILIPISAHGTNPASAVMAGFKVVVTKCYEQGNIDIEDLRLQAEKNKEALAGVMITYPSTHGVFEEGIKEMCEITHVNGGLVYMDGANMNAQVGFTSPGFIGADVCHLNLHKTFAIPHGGGGPGMGPICVNEKLAPFLPGVDGIGEVSAAQYGSASILLISYAYIKMLGESGLRKATEHAILNANYMKEKLKDNFKILFTGKSGTCAHEFIVDLRPFKASAGIEAEDVAKRLMDYGFHAPTLSFPVNGTIMIEPTESENKQELDRFCDALNSIYEEIKSIETGEADKKDNVLKNAPHTLGVITTYDWNHSYPRSKAAFPLPYLKENKFWPDVSRVNNTFGDRNLICTCEPIESYMEVE